MTRTGLPCVGTSNASWFEAIAARAALETVLTSATCATAAVTAISWSTSATIAAASGTTTGVQHRHLGELS